MTFNKKSIEKTISCKAGTVTIYHLPSLEKCGFGPVNQLPYSIKVLLESAVRNCNGAQVTVRDIEKICQWSPTVSKSHDIAFKPGRVILQDFTGVPCVVDLAAMRSALKRMGGDYSKVNPQVPCDLIIDHSLQIDFAGSRDALKKNVTKEFERNQERYAFLKWGQGAFKNFRVVPPATGIIHQINLEYLAKGVLTQSVNGATVAYPDTLVGTDSHTTMINGLGVIGWGVGGIEAEAVMLGEPIYMLLPEVIGVRLTGSLTGVATATDLALTVVEVLRKKNVVGKFVEFFGEGIASLSLSDRATVSNMCPEYGATIGCFAVDDETLNYYRVTGRSENEIDLLERYMKEQNMFFSEGSPECTYTDTVEIDLGSVTSSLAGPKRPQDRIVLSDMKKSFRAALSAPTSQKGYGANSASNDDKASVLTHGSVAIASITSCTNTSNPSALIGAALFARNAVKQGLISKPFVKTSFAPGSRVATEYLHNAQLLTYLEQLGFHVVGYGCATCIGNSGPLASDVTERIKKNDLVVASVSSGNRNFEGRIHPLVKANYLASPLLVVAYAIAGTVNIDLENEPIGKNEKGKNVFLKNIMPSAQEIDEVVRAVVSRDLFVSAYADVCTGEREWCAIPVSKGDVYEWSKESTYIQEPPFFMGVDKKVPEVSSITDARALVVLGDSVTTDHISPAGVISENSAAGKFLMEKNIQPVDFNSYGSRRGNDQVMTRGTFGNVRLRNLLAPGTEGPHTVHFPDNTPMCIYDAALRYKESGTPLIVLAGKEYGTGSSRDWAAKGTALLGVRAVVAESFERIHRSNLVGMGVLPLEFKKGDSRGSLGLTGQEVFTVSGLDSLTPHGVLKVTAIQTDKTKKEFSVVCRLDTPVEVEYYKNGGILQTVLRKLM